MFVTVACGAVSFNRIILAVPLFALGRLLTMLDFEVLWRYFSWSNQTLVMLVLWFSTAYLLKTHRKKWHSIITAVPALFKSGVSSTYILMAPEGFSLSAEISYTCGIIFVVCLGLLYINGYIKLSIREKNKIQKKDMCNNDK